MRLFDFPFESFLFCGMSEIRLIEIGGFGMEIGYPFRGIDISGYIT